MQTAGRQSRCRRKQEVDKDSQEWFMWHDWECHERNGGDVSLRVVLKKSRRWHARATKVRYPQIGGEVLHPENIKGQRWPQK